ncbi:DNA phosphorothioation-associated putative methyltransferase [Thiohalorhabdus methylotrophus]|uniref:DNA phosphorothioation-associated putative methyltransferase n=1 Tax=Thiohalorhabdus methylotrophus TaxID=3242694 RepID=A0ABV4TQH1_9GAMM
MTVQRERAAKFRGEVSRPARLVLETGLLREGDRFFDYGCGRGVDVHWISKLGFSAHGWDPAYAPDEAFIEAEIVNLGFVINVIEDPDERRETLRSAWELTQRALVVAVRLHSEKGEENWEPYRDGWLTAWKTFQKLFSQQELKDFVESTLGVQPVSLAPGIVLAFPDPADRQQFLQEGRSHRLAGQLAPRRSDELFEKYQTELESLTRFLEAHGRLPEPDEFSTGAQILEELGSIKKAAGIIRRVAGDEAWEEAREARTQDLLVHLGLERLSGLPKFSDLPVALQRDIKAFFGSYKKAQEEAEKLLFKAGSTEEVAKACKEAQCGKLTPEALYLHKSAVETLPPVLRIYEGCARVLLGDIEAEYLIKLNRTKPKISYLLYPEFEQDPHPALKESWVVSLHELSEKHYSFEERENPPILHRKETFIPESHPFWEKFARLTRQEEKWDLFDEPQAIGTRNGWAAKLEEKGAQLRGHRLVRQ